MRNIGMRLDLKRRFEREISQRREEKIKKPISAVQYSCAQIGSVSAETIIVTVATSLKEEDNPLCRWVYGNYLHYKKNKPSLKIPVELSQEIEESKSILDLRNGWDGKNSKGYKRETWDRAISFLMTLANNYFKWYHQNIPVPYIDPGEGGSIDFHWKTKKFELHLTFPEEIDKPVSYYGDDYGKNILDGFAEYDKINTVLSWLGNFL